MIQEFADKYIAARPEFEAWARESVPENYLALVKQVVKIINPDKAYGFPDPDVIHEIDDGHYQGTLVYVIPEVAYQPSDYWYVKVWYGSCSGCDTLEAIRGYSWEKPSDDQVKEYWTLGLHIVQGLKKMGGHAEDIA